MIGLFTSCEKNNDSDNLKIKLDGNAIIANEGSFGKANGSISLFQGETGTISNNSFKTVNNRDIAANIQSIKLYEGNLYCLTTGADELHILDATNKLKEDVNPIEGFANPRYFVAKGNKAYVSCYGENYYPNYADSYIAVIDLSTKEITKKIKRAGGFEGMAIIGNKLYAASINTKEVAIFDITKDEYLKSISIPENGRFLIETNNNNLWVSHSSYSSNDNKGLSLINTKEDTIEKTIKVPTMGASGFIASNKDVTNIYILGKEAYPGTKAFIVNFDVNTENTNVLIEGSSFYGFNYNHYTDRIYVLKSPDYTSNGSVDVYDSKGKNIYKDIVTGIVPRQVIFY